jgi:hypothetical protein
MPQPLRNALPVAALAAALSACAPRLAAHDPLTFGMVKEQLRAGVTTQEEVLRMFGSPNIITRTRAGEESWAYTRSAYGSSGRSGGITALGGGLAGPALAGGLASFWGYDSEASSRTTTVLVRFDAEGHVADYAAQETVF